MDKKEHQARHQMLHEHLDELVADFIGVTGALPSKTNLMDFIRWSHEQTKDPVEPNAGLTRDPILLRPSKAAHP